MCATDWQCLSFAPDCSTGEEIRLFKAISQFGSSAFTEIKDHLNKCFKAGTAHFLSQ